MPVLDGLASAFRASLLERICPLAIVRPFKIEQLRTTARARFCLASCFGALEEIWPSVIARLNARLTSRPSLQRQ